MSEVERRRESADKIQVAIDQFVAENEFDGILGDWMVIGSVLTVDEDGDPNGQYFVALRGGTMMEHTALGLIQKAKDVLDDRDD